MSEKLVDPQCCFLAAMDACSSGGVWPASLFLSQIDVVTLQQRRDLSPIETPNFSTIAVGVRVPSSQKQ